MCRTKTLGADRAKNWGPVDDARPGPVGASPQRVLLESPDGAEAWAARRILGRAGYDVAWCPGPQGSPRWSCPLVTSGSCPLVEHADAVVSSLPVDEERSRRVLDALAARRPTIPVVVSCTAHQARSWPLSWHVLQPLTLPITGTKLRAAVAAALG